MYSGPRKYMNTYDTLKSVRIELHYIRKNQTKFIYFKEILYKHAIQAKQKVFGHFLIVEIWEMNYTWLL